jgi:hypothetical protein
MMMKYRVFGSGKVTVRGEEPWQGWFIQAAGGRQGLENPFR